MSNVAIFLENNNWDDGWAGYIYAKPTNSPLVFVKNSTDQFGVAVKVYRTTNKISLETPGGVEQSNLVVVVN